jgi:carboxyl-terminal processing protease
MRTRALIAAIILGAAILIGARLARRAVGGGSEGARAELFDQVFARVQRDYVDTLAIDELYRKAATGMVAELHDPNSTMLDARRMQALAEQTAGAYDGVGVQIDARDGWLSVIAPLPGSPAEKAGIRPGDRIVEIDGRPVSVRALDLARAGLRGAPGTKVTLLVERPGVAARIPFTLVRAGIHVDPVRHAMMLTPTAGYVQLAVFAESSAASLHRSVESLRTRGARTLLLDLRGDPGGLLQQGVAVADEFLNAGQAVVTLRGRSPSEGETIAASAAQPWPGLLLVVLVDGGSASASELVAGALQDHDRAAVIGSTTYGKGSAQSIFRLDEEQGALRLTTALWFTPSGRSIQRRHAASGDSAAPADTLAEPPLAARKEFRTIAGRVVYGGGGITPDLIVAPQDSVDGTLALTRVLGKQLARFRDAVTDVAAAARAQGAGPGGAIEVTPAMRESLWRRLDAAGVHLTRARYDTSATAVDRMLGEEIAREAVGADAAYRRRLEGDRVVGAALALATGATSEREILARAADRRAAHAEDVARAP